MDEEDDIRRFLVRGTGSQMGANESAKDLLDAIKTVVDAILADTGTTLEAKLDLIRTELTFQHQADATLSQASPTQNQWYTILDTTLNAFVYAIAVSVATTGETLEVRLTIDGQTLTGSRAGSAGTVYGITISPETGNLALDAYPLYVGFINQFQGRSVKVEVRKTTASGTGTLSGRVIYGKR